MLLNNLKTILMTTRRFAKALMALAIALPMGMNAQVDVNREKYPDYSDKINPDWSMLEKNNAMKSAARTGNATQRPAYVNNAELKFFPPVFNQDGGSCGSASRISYMFTYEMNAYRDLNGKVPQNYYPSHFVWLLTNSSSGKNEFVTSIGVPSAATYGGQTYSSLFGNQDCADDDFGWMQGYDKWFEAMHNRMHEPVNFPLNVGTEEGRELVKNWLWNHNGDTSFKAGGICGIGVASSTGNYNGYIPSTEANRAAGVNGKQYVKAWGTQVDHALTIVGYDDRIEFDLDNNGIPGEVEKDEVGAWIIANSWGTWWGNNGFIYCPYAYAGPVSNSDGTFPGNNWWQPEIYKVRKDYRPLRTIKLEMDYSRRSELKLSAGISADITATLPEKSIDFEHFKYAGDGNYGNTVPAPEVPMLGRWADGKLHTEPMEFGYDLTDLTEGYDRSMPLKYFFIIETKISAVGEGNIYNASIIDYEFNREGVETPFKMPKGKVEVMNGGKKTIISVVVYGEEYYAPQNTSLSGRRLSWSAPLPSANRIEKYRIYNNGTEIAELDAESREYDIPQDVALEGAFGVTALYEGGVESQSCNATAPIAFEEKNMAVNLNYSGFRIPDIFSTKYDNATIEFYIKPNSLVSWNQSAGPGWGTFMMHSDSDGSFTAGWDTSNRLTTTSGVLKNGTWSHVALVVKENKMTVYVNGQNRGSVESRSYSGIGGFGDLVFTANTGSSNNAYMDAAIDEIRIWDKARTISEVRSGFKAQYSGEIMPEGLVAYYKGDLIEVNGQQMMRECISGNHAEILNNSYEAVESNVALSKPSSGSLTASINAVNKDVYAGTPVEFSATYSDKAVSLRWTIEDAGINSLAILSPSATFRNAGEQEVILVAEDAAGNSVCDTLTIDVKPEREIDATFSISKERVIVGEKVSFIVENPSFGQQYEWTIPGGEEEKVYGLHASTRFVKTGKQSVTLKVTSLNGDKSATSAIEVTVLESEPTAKFEINPAVILKGETTYLKDLSDNNPTEWEWSITSPKKKYLVTGQNSSFTPNVSGIYEVSLKAGNEIGSSTHTQQRALIVCAADSKNGLNFSGRENAKVEAPFSRPEASVMTVEWWMRPSELGASCLGLGESEAKFMLKTTENGAMKISANGHTGQSEAGFVIANEWHHYAVILENGWVDFYRDGEYFSTNYISSNAYIPSLSKFFIGHDNAKMNGQIDELRIWSNIVKNDDLLAVCNKPLENPEQYSNLLLYYDFNQSGGDVIDRSKYGRNGVRSGFGPDGDAWGLSRGVFCLNTDDEIGSGNVTERYLKNYKTKFETDGNKIVNNTVANRFYAIADWTIENANVQGSITTGVHVDAQKDYGMTFSAAWDRFTIINNHKVYQTITLPPGEYTFTAIYSNKWEGECDNSYIVANAGKGLPDTWLLDDATAFEKMIDKSSASSNSVKFSLDEETEMSLGLVVNMSNRMCMVIDEFVLERESIEYIEADGKTTGIENIVDVTEQPVIEGIYDLQGRRVIEPKKGGIYIINGNKVLVK